MDCYVIGRIPRFLSRRELAEARGAQTARMSSTTNSVLRAPYIALGFYMQVTKNDTYQGLASDLQSFGVFHNGRDGMHIGPCE